MIVRFEISRFRYLGLRAPAHMVIEGRWVVRFRPLDVSAPSLKLHQTLVIQAST